MSQTSNIGYLLQHLSGVLAKQNDQALNEQLDIGFSQFKILRVLQIKPNTSQKQIAQWLGQTEASISRQIRIMINKGLLQSSKSPNNKRKHLTTITTKGMQINDKSLEVLNKTHSQMFESLGQERQQLLVEALVKMHTHSCMPGRVGACNHRFDA